MITFKLTSELLLAAVLHLPLLLEDTLPFLHVDHHLM